MLIGHFWMLRRLKPAVFCAVAQGRAGLVQGVISVLNTMAGLPPSPQIPGLGLATEAKFFFLSFFGER